MHKKLRYLVVIFLMAFILPINVLAKQNITLKVDKTDLEIGDEITVSASIPSGVKSYALQATLKYDENVFEKIDDTAFTIDNTKSITYNEDNNKFGIVNQTGEIKDELFKIHLRVKENANAGNTNIALTNISSSDGEDEITFPMVSTKVSVTRDVKEGETITNTKENTINEEDENVIKTVSTNPIIISFLVIIVLLLIGILYMVTKHRDKKKPLYSLIVLEIILLITTVILLNINSSKKDVNKDGKKDYNDAKEIINYLINIEGTKKESEDTSDNSNEANTNTSNKSKKKFKYDVNNDGRININDAGYSTGNTTKETKVKLKEENKDDEYYVEKGKVTLKFTADITPSGVKITNVKIGNKYYSVKYTSGVYIVEVDYDKAGAHDFVIEGVKLSNGEERQTNLKIKKEVLKSKPIVKDLNYATKNSELEFVIEDIDNALQDAKLTIYEGLITKEDLEEENLDNVLPSTPEDSNDNNEGENQDDFDKIKIVHEEELSLKNKSYKVPVDLMKGGIYTVVITGSYDLDDNSNNDKNYYKNEIINDDLDNITIGKATIKPITELDTLYPKQGEKIEFNFDVEFDTDFNNDNGLETVKKGISQVVIDGVLKDVIYTPEGHYTINLDEENSYGIKSHKISAVILDDNTKMLCDYDIKYDVLKEVPEIKDFVYHKKDNKMTFSMSDKDNALKKANIIITSENNNTVLEQQLDVDKKDYEIEKKLDKGKKYNVKITGSYELASDNSNEQTRGIKELTHEFVVYDVALQNKGNPVYYAQKNGDITLKFNSIIKPENNKAKISKVTINGAEVSPNINEEGIYSVNVKAPKTAGKIDYKIENIILEEGELTEEVDESLTLHADILKSEPTITNLVINQTTDTPEIEFTLNDEDDALADKPGELVIKKSNMEDKVYPIKKGDNCIKLDDFASSLEQGSVYNLDIKVNYDLDSDKANNLNEEKGKKLVEDHVIKFYKAILTADSTNNFYVVKNTKVPFKITSKITPEEEGVTIKSFIIKGEKQPIETELKDGKYIINLSTPNEDGEKTYKVEKIILSNDIEVKAPLDIKVDVLKDMPYINKLNLNNTNTALSYELKDNDNALTDGTITISNNKGNESISEKIDESGKIEYNFKDGETYVVKVIGDYNLASTKINGEQEGIKGINKELSTQSFIIGGDYNFSLTNASITDAVKSGEKPIISFKSTNSRKSPIEKAYIKIDGGEAKSYNVTNKIENDYEVLLDDADLTSGKHTVTLESVVLKSLKEFKNNKDYKASNLTYTILGKIPEAKNITLKDNKTSKNIDVEFNIVDTDSVTKNLTIALVESNGKIVTSKKVTIEEGTKDKTIKVSLPYTNSTDGRYTVKVLADYELADKYNYTNQNIGEESILTHSKDDIYINNIYVTNDKNVNTGNIYPTKNEKNYQIAVETFVGDSIKSGKTYGRVSSLNINGVNYPAYQISGFNSKIYVNIPNKAGVIELKANRVQLASDGYYKIYNDYYSVEEQQFKIEVLKDKPKIENLTIKENYEEGNVTFKFNVTLDETATKSEDEFKDGTIELNGKTQDIHRGENEITFQNIEKDKTFDLIFKGSFDLDTDALNINGEDKNSYTKTEFYRVKYGLYNKEEYSNINISDGKIVNGNNNKYFEKNEKIKVSFNINGIDDKLGVLPEKVVVDEKEYTITKVDDGYELVLDGYHSFGEKEITITDIILNNSKKVKLNNSYTFKPEVLKDAITIDTYSYEVVENNIKVKFNLKDTDNSIVNKAKVIITDGMGNIIPDEKGNNTHNYKDEISFSKEDDVVTYYVKVIADYDRDIDKTKDSDNYNKEVVLLDEVISLEKNNIELKDIADVNLYKIEKDNGSEKITLKDEVNVDDLTENKEQYFVEIVMNNFPTTHAKIKSIINKNNNLTLVLEYQNVIKEDSNEKEIMKINFGPIKNKVAKNNTHPKDAFESLIEELKEGKDVTLDQNYDAADVIVSDDTYVPIEYSGTLNGNGYTIKNLSKPLFSSIKDGTVKNVKLEDIKLPGTNAKGLLAPTVINSTISQVFVNNYNKEAGEGETGVLIGKATNTTITECRATNFKINLSYFSQQSVGGLVGVVNNTTIKNSYAIGTIPGGGWNFRGGIAGRVEKESIFIHNLSKVKIDVGYGNDLVCGIACGNASRFIGNVSLSSGIGKTGKIYGSAIESTDNFYLGSETEEAVNQTGVTKIIEEDINTELFRDKAKFNEDIEKTKETSNSKKDDIWNLNNISKDLLPTFSIESKTKLETKEGYEEKKKTLYYNLSKLTPYYDSDKIIKTAESVNNENLKNKEIKYILPVDINGDVVTYLTTDNIKKISKIKVLYNDGTKEEFSVLYDKTYDMIATYKINNLGIDYNFKHYVINSDSQLVTNLVNYLSKLDYTNNLDILTTNDDSRIYRDFYNETTKNELKEFVLKYLANSNYTNTTNDETINNYLEREIKEDKRLEKVLYVYNYFRRFYNLDINGIKVYDIMMFNLDLFDDTLTPDKVASLYLQDTTGASFNTNQTNAKYREILSGYTKIDKISSLLEFLVTGFSDINMNDWVRSQFKGKLVEIKIDGHENVKYTLWDHFITDNRDEILNQFLPILTLPKNAAYILSMPVQYIIGAQRTYIANPDDEKDQQALDARINTYVRRMKRYFETAYSILEDDKLFNDILIYHVDKRYTKTETNASIYNTPYTTTEPFHKNFVEVTGLWAAAAGNNAAAWGPRVEWQVAGVLDSTLADEGYNDTSHVTFRTWSHESAHVIDARLFLKNNGRRFDAGGEDYADAFLMQSFGEKEITMNLSMMLNGEGVKVGSNSTPDKINSKEKIHNYYRKVFETIYVMDYIEAKAFLQLTKEEQKALAVQVSYPNSEIYKDEFSKYRARETSRFTHTTEIDSFNTKLDSIDDLIDNKIMLYPGVYKYSSRGNNSYGGEGFNTVHWYQPNNPDGRPDSYALKWISYEMLGYKGYDKGFVEYASNIHSVKKEIYKNLSKPEEGKTTVDYKSDSMALKEITDGEFTDFDTYKKARFKEVEEKISKLDSNVNVKEYVQKFYESLKQDAYDLTEGLNKFLTGWPTCPNEYWCSRQQLQDYIAYKHSTQIRDELYYKLKNNTKDFTEEIYKNEYQQDVSDLTVDKK